MRSHAILGLGFGDEGKGKVTDFLCSRNSNSIVARFSGGQQAGHMVMKEDHNHVFSNFGSGTLSYAPTYWSKYCTVDPVGIINELQILSDKGYSSPDLFIDPKCPVTTPFDKISNQNNNLINENGSCGVGVGTTFKREENFYSLLFEDLFFPSIVKMKLDLIRDYYHYDLYDITNKYLEEFLNCCEFIRNNENILQINQKVLCHDTVIFEGSQGLLLDQHFGFFPHCTPSNVGTKNILEMGYEPEVWLVTRAYQTRHGNGPMTNEDIRGYDFNIKNKYEHNKEHEYQGEFRISMLDLDLLEYAIMKDEYINTHRDNLVINHLDCLDNFKLTHRGEIISFDNYKQFVKYIAKDLRVRNVYTSNSPYSNDIF